MTAQQEVLGDLDEVPDSKIRTGKIEIHNTLCFKNADISSEEGLSVLEAYGYKCGYHYNFRVSGSNVEQLVFYNGRHDIFTCQIENGIFCPQRLVIVRDSHSGPISIHESYKRTQAPTSCSPNRLKKGLQPVGNINSLKYYGGNLFPILGNYKTSLYGRNKKDNEERKMDEEKIQPRGWTSFEDRLGMIMRLVNCYQFGDTYTNFDDELKSIYANLVKKDQGVPGYVVKFYQGFRDLYDLKADEKDYIVLETAKLIGRDPAELEQETLEFYGGVGPISESSEETSYFKPFSRLMTFFDRRSSVLAGHSPKVLMPLKK